MLRKGLSLTLIVTLTWHCWAFAAPAPATPTRPDAISEPQVVQSLEELADLGHQLRPRIDRSLFDLDALLESLDHDAEQIAEFVTNEIALEVYSGALRGAPGTLISRAGNSLDQALLLATLLKNEGFDAVIRQGKISEAEASAVVESMAAPRPEAPSIWLETPEMGRSTAPPSTEPDSNRAALIQAARDTSHQITKTLTDAAIEVGDPAIMAAIREEARDYYWVDYRSGATDDWQSFHPAFSGDLNLAEKTTFSDEIPPELSHKVIIEVLVAQRRGNKTEESPLMAPIELTSANLVGAPLTFALVPDQILNQDSPLDANELASKTRFLLPMINGALAPGGKALSLRGLLVPLDSLGMGAAGFFETQSEKTAQAVDALSGLGGAKPKEESAVAIEALRLQVTLRSPDGTERIESRKLFDEKRDLTPEAIRAKTPGAELVLALAATHTFVSATGSYAYGYVIDSLLAQMESLDSLLKASSYLSSETCRTIGCFAQMEWEAPDPGPSLAMLFLGFDGVLSEQQGGINYRHTPNLVRLSQTLVPPKSGRIEYPRIDIISNARRALLVRNDRLEPAPRDLMLAGVWETQIETEVLAKSNSEASPPERNTADLRVYNPQDVQPFAASRGIARAMLRELDNGYLVLSGDSLDFDNPTGETRWWRVDPVTGETLGMDLHGGSVIVEGLILLIGTTLFVIAVSTPVYTYNCWRNGNGSMRACFLCDNPVMFGLWAAASLWVATGLTYDEFQDWSFQEERWEFVTGCTAIID